MLFNDGYNRYTYFLINDKKQVIVDLCRFKKINKSILTILSSEHEISIEGSYNDIKVKKDVLLFFNNKICLNSISIKNDNIILNALIEAKGIKFSSLDRIDGCDAFFSNYGTVLSGNINDLSLERYKTFYILTSGKKTPKNYYYIAGCYKEFEGGFFLKLSNFNYNRVDCIMYNIYHGNVSKTKGKSKLKFDKDGIKLKFSDYKNSIKIYIKLGKKYRIEDLGDNIDKIYKDIYLDSIMYCEIQDDNFTKVFTGYSDNTIIEKREYNH